VPQGLFFIHAHPEASEAASNAWQGWRLAEAPMGSPWKELKCIISIITHPRQWRPLLYPASAHAFIPSANLQNTSLPVATADAIGSAKSSRNLMPFLWDLIGLDARRKLHLLLPW
jgi:hypothetical protein